MAFLRAFVDDSSAQGGDKRLFYAGYLHRADAWADFSEAWDWELRQWPEIAYYKGSGDQFAGWEDSLRTAKLYKLAQIIQNFQPFSFHFSLNRKMFDEDLKPVSPYGLGRPHFVACFAVMAGVARYAASENITTPIEFIFDEQDGVDQDVRTFFSEMLAALPDEARSLISGEPWFKNDRDKHFMPLQAADMLAWHLRRRHEYPEQKLPLLSILKNQDGHLEGEIPDGMILEWANHHRSLPGVPLIKSKPQWKRLTREIKRLRAAGIDPTTVKQPGIYYPKSATLLLRGVAALQRLFRSLRQKP